MRQTADLIVFACTNSFSLPFDAVKTITVVCRLNVFNYLESIYGSNVHLQRKYFYETITEKLFYLLSKMRRIRNFPHKQNFHLTDTWLL